MTSSGIAALAIVGAMLCVICILLVPLAAVGLALIGTGLGRSRSAAHSMLSALMVISVAMLVYCICGFAWQGYSSSPAHVFTLKAHPWNWIASERWFLRGLDLNGSSTLLVALLQMFSVGLVAVVPLGSGADRWRLGPACISTALLAGFVYPLFSHWVWGGGWLAQLGTSYGLGRGFLDAAGGSTIQAVSGLSALALAWILGPRSGKYSADGMPAAIPGHNAVLVMIGCLLAWIGWLGLNAAGAMLFASITVGRVLLVTINTTLAAAAAALAAAVTTRLRFSKPDASLTANGWIGGLAASSAVCAFVVPAAAVAIGLVAGVLVVLAIDQLEFRLGIDDPAGSISAHAVAGIWGILAVALFGHTNTPGQGWAQLIGVATLLGFVLPLAYALNWLLDKFLPQRVAVEAENQGLDVHELGAEAYPDFLTHTEDLYR